MRRAESAYRPPERAIADDERPGVFAQADFPPGCGVDARLGWLAHAAQSRGDSGPGHHIHVRRLLQPQVEGGQQGVVEDRFPSLVLEIRHHHPVALRKACDGPGVPPPGECPRRGEQNAQAADRHSEAAGHQPTGGRGGRRLGSRFQARAPLTPPDVQLPLVGIHGIALLVGVAVDRQPFPGFPSLHGADAVLQIGGNFLPGMQPSQFTRGDIYGFPPGGRSRHDIRTSFTYITRGRGPGAGGQGARAGGQGPGARGRGPGAGGQGARGRGPGAGGQGPGARGPGPGARGRGPGAGGRGPGPGAGAGGRGPGAGGRGRGPGAGGRGPGAGGQGPGARGRGPGARGRGPGAGGQGARGRGPGAGGQGWSGAGINRLHFGRFWCCQCRRRVPTGTPQRGRPDSSAGNREPSLFPAASDQAMYHPSRAVGRNWSVGEPAVAGMKSVAATTRQEPRLGLFGRFRDTRTAMPPAGLLFFHESMNSWRRLQS